MFTQTRIPLHIRWILLAVLLGFPLLGRGSDPSAPFEQEFLLTAYYSPKPEQCCYVKGGYEADKLLNGNGTNGADGTPVYSGMIAAPARYVYGTVVALPGIGTFTVHDRGGAIREQEDGLHRIDIWVGGGEEGLARALTFGVRKIKGTVFPVGSAQPKEVFALKNLPVILARLEKYQVGEADVLALSAAKGETSLSVKKMQEHLRTVGYFRRTPTGFFGEETAKALASFVRSFGLDEPTDHLTLKTAAYLQAASRRMAVSAPVSKEVDPASSKNVVQEAQRVLRFLGYYRGRTHGMYDDKLFAAILRFQQEQGLVGDAGSPGAGRIGPLTRAALKTAWNRRLIAKSAENYLTLKRVEELIASKGLLPDRYLSFGDKGDDVRLLQELLSDRGLFPKEKVNGNFGERTRASVIAFQKDRHIIDSENAVGAGIVGPATLVRLRHEERLERYRLVRSEGWKAL